MGGYTNKSLLAHAPEGGEGKGLYSVLLDPDSGKLAAKSTSTAKENPAFILKHPTLDVVYMTTEVIEGRGSELLVGRLDRRDGSVEVVDRKWIHGKSSCHCEWDFSRSHLVVVSYWDSRLTTFPLHAETGLLGEAATVYADQGAHYVEEKQPDRWEHLAHRQRWPHLHQVNKDPYSKAMFMVPDLGRDQVHFFSISQGSVRQLGAEQLRRGMGPRHMDFSKRHKVVYVCGELDNTVTVFQYNQEAVSAVLQGEYFGDTQDKSSPSVLTEVQKVSTVPSDLTCKSTIAEMRLHPNGRFLYVGNRGHNSIAVFSVAQEEGSLALVAVEQSCGASPRHFNFDNTGEFLLVGNHASDNIVAFRISRDSGRLTLSDKMDHLPSIVWVTPLAPQE